MESNINTKIHDIPKKNSLDQIYQADECISQQDYIESFNSGVNWMLLEEKFRESKQILTHIAEYLAHKDRMDVACSIIARHNLFNDSHCLNEATITKLSTYVSESDPSSLSYIPNKLFTADDFVPAEEILGTESSGSYLSFKDFEIEVTKDVNFISDEASEAFRLAEKDLVKSEEIGIAVQQKIKTVKFENSPVATLQLANHQKVYIFDAISLRNSSKLKNLLQKIFYNPEIYIVGHSLGDTLKKLKELFPKLDTRWINKKVEISFVYRKLYHEEGMVPLSEICEEILHKPTSSQDEYSNWNYRPLRKAQIHYAGLNAFVVLKIFGKLSDQIISRGKTVDSMIQVKSSYVHIPFHKNEKNKKLNSKSRDAVLLQQNRPKNRN